MVKLPEIRGGKRSTSSDLRTSSLRNSSDRTWDNINKAKMWGMKSSERLKLKPYLLRL